MRPMLRESNALILRSHIKLLLWLAGLACLAPFVASQEAWMDTVSMQTTTTFPCTLLLNATGSIGCQTFGATGTLYSAATQEDIDAFVDGRAGPTAPGAVASSWVPVMPMNLLTEINLNRLRETNRLAGVIVVPPSQEAAASFGSPDIACPNCQFTYYANTSYANHTWNLGATALNFRSWDFPIFGAWNWSKEANATLSAIRSATAYNAAWTYSKYPLYAVDFDALMYAASNSPTCLRRQFCDPIGGYSVWSAPVPAILPGKPIVLFAATLDATSVFHDLASGLSTHLGGLIALLAAADAVMKAPVAPAAWEKDVVFAFFNAEQWGHAGSQRFVQDISSFKCLATSGGKCPLGNGACANPCVANVDFKNISLDAISQIVEINQIGPKSQYLYFHVDMVDPNVVTLVDELRNVSYGLNMTVANALGPGRLPPSAALAFLAKRRIPAAVISDFSGEFQTPFYNSELDAPPFAVPSVETVCSVATLASRAAYRLAGNFNGSDSNSTAVDANCTLVAELLECLTGNFSCSLVQSLVPNNIQRTSSYPGVFSFGSPTPLVYFVSQFMKQKFAYQVGSPCNKTCESQGVPMECIAGVCRASLTRYHQAYGTGLSFNPSSGLFEVVDGTLGTWTESRWTRTTMRLFQVPGGKWQAIEIGVGVSVGVLSVVAGWVGKRGFERRLGLRV